MATMFDPLANEYDADHQKAVAASGFPTSYFHEYKVKEIRRILKKLKRKLPSKILDFGCGIGNADPFIRKYFPNAEIFGVDISEVSIKIAREKQKSADVSYAVYNTSTGGDFPFDISFDLIFVAGVIHHVPHREQGDLFACIERCMLPGTLLFVFEHNPYNPATRMVFKKSDKSFDKDAELICPKKLKMRIEQFEFRVLKCNFTLFFPKFLRALIPLEIYLSVIPFGAQYYIMAEKL